MTMKPSRLYGYRASLFLGWRGAPLFDGLTLVEAVSVQVGGWTARTVFPRRREGLAQPRARARVLSFLFLLDPYGV